MTIAEQTSQQIAETAAAWFQTAERASSGDTFDRIRDGAPEWIKDAVRDAHDDMLPDDYVYGYARAAFDWIAENDGDEDSAAEFADNVDVYSADLLAWLSSHSARRGFVEEARSEGLLSPDADLDKQMMAGQYLERQRVYSVIWKAVEAQVEEISDAAHEQEQANNAELGE